MSTRHFNITEHVLDAAYIREYPRALADNKDDQLKLHVKQYIPKEAPRTARCATVIGAHANAFPKELYEPLWDELYSRCSSHGFEIGSVWIADMAWQGESGALNENKLGNDPGWFDHSRDLLHIINTFRHEMPQPLIGIGHSMGACQIDKTGSHFGAPWQSSYRKDIWPSRQEAADSFKKSPFYQSWDPRVLELWIEFGLRDLPTALYPEESDVDNQPVTLRTTRSQEVWSFLRPNYDGQGRDGINITNRLTHADVDPSSKLIYPYYRPEIRSVFLRLPALRPPTYYIMGEMSILGSQESQYEKVPLTGIGVGGSGGAKEGKVGHVFLKGVGHLVPMDDPIETAKAAVEWLGKTVRAWFEEAEEFQLSWSKVDKKDKMMLDKQWYDHIGPPPGRSSRQKNKL